MCSLLGQYSQFHEVDLGIISQFQYKHEGTTYESVSDQGDDMWSPKVNEMCQVCLLLIDKAKAK